MDPADLGPFDPLASAPPATLSFEAVQQRAARDRLTPQRRELLDRVMSRSRPHLGEPSRKGDLAATGWAAVFPQAADPAVERALAPLLARRQEQAGKGFHLFAGADGGYRPGESADAFLRRHGAGTGGPSPDKVPFYLLVVGSPAEIPFDFQTELDVQGYAVGRLGFPSPDGFRAYAESVVAAETGGSGRARRIALFGVADENDDGQEATQQMCAHLVTPLADALAGREGWEVAPRIVRQGSTRTGLAATLSEKPALLFTASHGLACPDRPDLRPTFQGALVCRRPETAGESRLFTGNDVVEGTPAAGLLAFLFACHSAGTPAGDPPGAPPQLSHLPERLLTHPRGGALAVLGHVGPAWGYSFLGFDRTVQPHAFVDTFTHLLDGLPVGAALEPFNLRHAEFLIQREEEAKLVKRNEERLTSLWAAAEDARNFVILGDPAVRVEGSPRG